MLNYFLRKKKKTIIVPVNQPIDPYKEAIEQLEKLQRDKPEAKQYYSRLVDIFKEYIAAKRGIHSLQATTHDLVGQLKSLGLSQFDELSRSLSLSDFVKFAKYIPSAEDDKDTFTVIFKSIQQIEQQQ